MIFIFCVLICSMFFNTQLMWAGTTCKNILKFLNVCVYFKSNGKSISIIQHAGISKDYKKITSTLVSSYFTQEYGSKIIWHITNAENMA